VEVDNNTNEVICTAQFRVGTESGDTVRLLNPSYVEVNGYEMRLRHGGDRFDSWSGTDYVWDDFNPDPKEFLFVWHKSDGAEVRTPIEHPLSIAAKNSEITVFRDRKNSLELNFQPEDSAWSDMISGALVIGNEYIYGQVTNGILEFETEQLQFVPDGEAELILERRLSQTKVETSTPIAASITRIFRSKPIPVKITSQ
jgi:hypothetical protein